MTNLAGAGPPTGLNINTGSVYTDLTNGQRWAGTGSSWRLEGAAPPSPVDPPPPPVEPPPPTPTHTGLRAFLTSEMTNPHHGPLDGVPPGYDWATGPRLGGGNNRGGNQASTAWAQVYTSGGQSGGTVEIANLTLATLTNGRWAIIQRTKPAGSGDNGGGYFIADFAGNATAPGREPRGGPGGTIVGEPVFGWNLHTWGSPRSTLPEQFDAICAWFDARLLSPGGRFLAGAGGDYYVGLETNPPQGDWAIGRLSELTPAWSTHCCHTMTAAQIANGPLPPIVIAGGAVTPPPVVPPTTGAWKLPTGRPVKVMFAGDSITRMMAEDPMGLATLAGQLPFDVELVGSETTGTGLRHEGRGAWCADDTGGRCQHTNGYHAGGVLQNIAGWVTASRPDIIVLNVGQNDRYVRAPLDAAQTAAAIGRVIDAVHNTSPWTMVVVTTFGHHNADVNPLIEQQTIERGSLGRPVRFFDMYRGWLAGDWAGPNDIHPSPSGVVKMVAATAAALTVLASAGLTG